MNDTTRKKKHHFIPRLYLEGFCDQQGMVWTYHKKDADKKSHCQKPENTAFINYFYALYSDDGTLDSNTFEDALAEIIESPSASAIKSLRSGQIPSHEDRQRLALLFGYMLVRTPSYRAHYEKEHNKEFKLMLINIAGDVDRFGQLAADYEKINNEPLADDVEEFRLAILAGDYNPQIHPNVSLHIMNSIGSASAALLVDMKWILLKAPENLFFLTSDSPIFITNPAANGFYSPGLLTLDTRVFVPISKDIGLLMIRTTESKLDNQIVNNNMDVVKEMNKAIILTAQEFIYSCENDKEINRLIGDLQNELNVIVEKIKKEDK